MSNDNSYFTVKIFDKDLEGMLSSVINSPNKDIVVEIIMKNLSKGNLGQLYKALSGIKTPFEFKVDDEVLIPITYLPTWRIDKDLLSSNPNFYRDSIKGIVQEVDITKEDSVSVKFQAIMNSSTTKELEDFQYWFEPHYLKKNNFDFPI